MQNVCSPLLKIKAKHTGNGSQTGDKREALVSADEGRVKKSIYFVCEQSCLVACFDPLNTQ